MNELFLSSFFSPFCPSPLSTVSLSPSNDNEANFRGIYIKELCNARSLYIALIDLRIEFWNIVSFLPNTILLNFIVTDTISIMIVCIYIY